jgi:cell division protein FtsQ
MHRRGRLAQSLKFNGRIMRAVRRCIARLDDLNPPRGVGSFTAGAIVLASIGYGTVAGGHVAEISAEMRRTCDAVSNRAGFQISSVALSGEKQLSRTDVLSLAGIDNDSSLPCLDASVTRTALMTNPWIEQATVLKLYPGRLQVEIVERVPLALWQKDGRLNVIAHDGTVLEEFTGERFRGLPQVVGQGAARQARDFLAVVSRYPLIGEAVEASVLIAERRWNLRLKSGIDVRLPDGDVEPALQTLATLDRDKKLLSRDISVIDLRQADRVTVRLSDDAAAVRAEAIKEMLKKQQGKKKGSSA